MTNVTKINNTKDERREFIAARWTECLNEKGLSIVETIRQSGVKESSFNNIIYGRVAKPKPDLVKAVAKVLGVSPEYLLLETDDPTPKREEYSLDKPFDFHLHTNCISCLYEMSAGRKIELSAEQVEELSKVIYYYHRKDDQQEINRTFVDYLLDQL